MKSPAPATAHAPGHVPAPRHRGRWHNLLPWNWFKCCKQDDSSQPLVSNPPLTREQADATLNSPFIDTVDAVISITEPINTLIRLHSRIRTDIDPYKFNIYLENSMSESGFAEKDIKQLPYFTKPGFGTNKDFISWLFGKNQQSDYVLYAGTKKEQWIKLAFTGEFTHNRIFKAVHKNNGETYIVTTNCPYKDTSKFVIPSQRYGKMASHLIERSDLSKAPTWKTEPVAANTFSF